MNEEYNHIGIYNNLDRPRIRKLLTIGLMASILTGIGDFLLGFAQENTGEAANLAAGVMSNASNLSDAQLIAGGLLGVLGIALEGLSLFAVYRLMADAAPGYAHCYRTGIIGYLWLAPVGCHLNMGILNLAYKYLLLADADVAAKAAKLLFYGFSLPIYVLLALFWIPTIVLQFKAFAKGYTPYPKKAKWFNVPIGAIPALVLCVILGPHTAWGSAVGTMFLSFGNAFVFGGLLRTLPSEETFATFRAALAEKQK